MAVVVNDLRTLLKMEQLQDPDIEPHLARAVLDFSGTVFDSVEIEKEAVGSKAIYYIAPLLWLRIQQRVNEYDESLETFKDVKSFQAYWLDRSRSAAELGTTAADGLQWREV